MMAGASPCEEDTEIQKAHAADQGGGSRQGLFPGPLVLLAHSRRKSGNCEWFPVKSVSRVPVEEIETDTESLVKSFNH